MAAGLLFWLQLIGSRPVEPAATPLRRLALVVATVGVTTIVRHGAGLRLCACCTRATPISAHHVMTVLDDQQLAGAVYWMGMLPPLIVAAVAVLTGG